MAKFIKKNSKKVPSISTASLPDIVFMLLFFFMVTTHLRDTNLNVSYKLPKAVSAKKLEKKSLISTIHIGPPIKQLQGLYGTAPRIQLNGQIITNMNDIKTFISSEREALNEFEQKQMSVSLKIDENTHMGLVTSVKQILRQSNALRINYSTQKNPVKKRDY